MTRVQAKEKLIAMGIAEPTDEQITALLNTIQGEVDPLRSQLTTANQQSANAQELQTKLDDVTAKLAAMTRSNIKAQVQAIFASGNLAEDDYKDFIDGFVTDDEEASKARANAFVKTLNTQRTNAEAKVKESYLDNTKGLGGNGGSPSGGQGSGSDDEPEDVKFAKAMNFGARPDSTSTFDYYKK